VRQFVARLKTLMGRNHMALKLGRVWFACGVLSLGACSAGGPSSEGTGVTGRLKAASSQTITASMALPFGLTSAGFLVAQTNIQLDSNVSIAGPVWSAGTLSVQPDVRVSASIVATGNVVLTDRDVFNTTG
jgi:hypothetical protein